MRLVKVVQLAPPFTLTVAVAGVLGPYCFGPTVAATASHATMAQGATHVLAIGAADHALMTQGATHVLSVAAAQHAVKAGCDCE